MVIAIIRKVGGRARFAQGEEPGVVHDDQRRAEDGRALHDQHQVVHFAPDRRGHLAQEDLLQRHGRGHQQVHGVVAYLVGHHGGGVGGDGKQGAQIKDDAHGYHQDRDHDHGGGQVGDKGEDDADQQRAQPKAADIKYGLEFGRQRAPVQAQVAADDGVGGARPIGQRIHRRTVVDIHEVLWPDIRGHRSLLSVAGSVVNPL